MAAKCAPRSDGPSRNHDSGSNNHQDTHHDNQQDNGNHCQPGGVVSSTTTTTITSAMAITASIAADAVGTDTFAAATLDITMVQRGLLTYASGSATALAAAQSSAGAMQYAATSILLDVAGADLLSYSAEEQAASGGAIDSSVSGLSFLAIDTSWLTRTITDGQEHRTPATTSGSLSGNVAEFAAHLEVAGDNGFTDLAVDSFAVEDQLSSSYISASAGVASETVFQTMTGTRFADTVITTNADTIVRTSAGKDVITARDGDDWIFSGAGKDKVDAGAGDDTVFGGDGDDNLSGGLGDDWLFGGRGADDLYGGAGNDLLFGGAGKDMLDGGAGNDLFNGGDGDDTLFGGAGNDLFRLGSERGDDDDTYTGGAGADLYLIVDRFDDDVIRDFRLSEGDRLLMRSGDWESSNALRAHNGADITLERGSDADDLVITIDIGRGSSSLTLDEFFVLNAGYGAAPRRGEFSDAQALALLQDLFGDDAGTYANATTALFAIGEAISDLG